MKKVSVLLSMLLLALLLSYCGRSEETDSANETEQAMEEPDIDYAALGKSIVDSAFLQLSSALMNAMAEKGPEYALEYCNQKALPITAAVSEKYGATVSRKASRYRNPVNQTSDVDELAMTAFQNALDEGRAPEPLLNINGESYTYYHPILMQPQCLGCHGSKAEIGPLYKTISALYPEDKAYDFSEGELRGLWKVEF